MGGLGGCLETSIAAMSGQLAEIRCKFLCLFVFFVADKTRAARGLFSSHKETQEDTEKYEERAGPFKSERMKYTGT